MTESKKLYETVIKNGYCIGCGVCEVISGSPFTIGYNKYGNLVANADLEKFEDNETPLLEICPFSDSAKNEDELSEIFFPDIDTRHNEIGTYTNCYAGYVKENEFREKGSSGGFAKWIGYQLLKLNEIDYFIQLAPNDSNDSEKALFEYRVFKNREDVIAGSKSAYYPTSLNKILKYIEEHEGRYAITGVPCNIKALRLLSLKNELLKSRVKFTIGIVCGGMKSANYSKLNIY